MLFFAQFGFIAGSLHGLRTRDELPVVILNAIGGCFAGFLLTILLMLTFFRHMDM